MKNSEKWLTPPLCIDIERHYTLSSGLAGGEGVAWLKGNIMSGLAIGIGSAIIAPMVAPALSKAAKPLVKAAIKGGLMLFETGKEKLAEAHEIVDDLLAEARAEPSTPEGYDGAAKNATK
jgi:hypothetical protein